MRKVEDDELERLRLIRADAGRALNGLKKKFNKSKKSLRQSGVKFSLKGEIDLLSVPGGLEEARLIAVSQYERTDRFLSTDCQILNRCQELYLAQNMDLVESAFLKIGVKNFIKS